MSQIKPEVSGSIRAHIETAIIDLTVGVFNPDDGYWSDRNCLYRVRNELQRAVEFIDAELKPAPKIASAAE